VTFDPVASPLTIAWRLSGCSKGFAPAQAVRPRELQPSYGTRYMPARS
jgi:hypothetical protein